MTDDIAAVRRDTHHGSPRLTRYVRQRRMDVKIHRAPLTPEGGEDDGNPSAGEND